MQNIRKGAGYSGSSTLSLTFLLIWLLSSGCLSAVNPNKPQSSSSFTFNTSSGAPNAAGQIATRLSFSLQPGATTTAGATWSVQPIIVILDQSGNGISTATNPVTLSAYTDPSCTVSATGILTAVSNPVTANFGFASFSGMTFSKAGTIYLSANSPGLVSVCSNAVNVGPSTPARVVFSVQPSNSATAGAALAVSPSVTIEDAYGNTVTTSTLAVTLSPFTDSNCSISGTGTLAATTNPLNATAGIAAFSNLSYTKSGSVYLMAQAPGLTNACSSAVTISPAAASKLVFSTQPSATAGAGVNFATQPVVSISDTYGNIVSSASGSVTLSAHTDSGCSANGAGTLNVTTNPTATSSGVATFSGVNYTKLDTLYLSAESVGLTSACSSLVTVSSGPLHHFQLSGDESLKSTSCSSAYVAIGIDAYDNIASMPSAQTVNLSSNGNAIFYSDPNCSNPTASVVIPMNSNSQRFYIKDATVESLTISAAAPGVTTGTISVSISATALPIEVATGLKHSCARFNNGTIHCWGRNFNGELGDNLGNNTHIPTQVSGITNAAKIAVDDKYGCAVLSDGRVQCWGYNAYAQLGNGTLTDSTTPTLVSGINNAINISTGTYQACALLSTGGVSCWGYNTNGQLGNGTTATALVPVPVANVTNAIQLMRGANITHNCVILVDRSVQCWGYGIYGQLGNGSASLVGSSAVKVNGITTAVSISGGALHSCAALANGSVQCWGYNGNGQLGDGTYTNSLVPVSVAGLTTATQVFGFAWGNCAVLANGSLTCWGSSGNGELRVRTGNYNTPTPIGAYNSVKQGSGYAHLCVVLASGSVECWGSNTMGQLGNNLTNELTPVSVLGITTASTTVGSIAGGAYHTCVILADSTVQCWGNNQKSQLGDGTTTSSSTPVAVAGLINAIYLAAGNQHTCALISNGTIQCWGYGLNGQLGDGLSTDSLTPTSVSGITTAVKIASSLDATCALLSNQTIQCWGLNSSGQLGNGTTTTSGIPVSVSGITTATDIISGGTGNHFCAVLSNGSIQCWGDNSYGQLGNGTTTTSSLPVTVTGISTAVTVTAGDYTSCAILSGGSAKCWGYGSAIGSGSFNNSTTPVSMLGVSSASVISLGGQFGCLALTNGTVQCWGGNNISGNLGIGTDAALLIAVSVTGLTTGSQIAASSFHSCAVLSNNTVQCWGFNGDGQLGNGKKSIQLTPSAVVFP